jgi:DNA-binding XRE family transcriptional regulator
VSRPPPKAASPRKSARANVAALVPAPIYFGQRIKELREAAGLSQTDLSKLVGIPQPDLPAIERGARDIRLSTADRFAKAFGVPLRDMLP